MKKNSLVGLSCILSLITLGVRADDTQEPIVVTATRVPTPQGTALGSTTVITEHDIAQAQSPTLVDALQDLGGVQFARNGGPGTVSSVFLRGANSNQALILLDGVPIQTATLGTAPLEHISPAQIERIEIVRGNVSSLYGANAVGGVIQIFTKTGAKPVATLGAGSYRTRSVDIGTGNTGGTLDLSVHGSYFESSSFSPLKPENGPTVNVNSRGYRNSSASIKASHSFDADQEIGASYYATRAYTQFNSAFATSAVDLMHSEESLGVADVYSRNALTANWRSLLRYARTTDYYESFVNAVSDGRILNNQDQFTWQNDVRIHGRDTLIIGAEELQQHVGGDTVYARNGRRVDSAFTGYTANLGRNRLEASVRRDDYNDFGPHNSGSAGYGYSFTPRWEVHTIASTAFRAPTFNDLYYVNPYFVGNPGLRPERSRNLEAGIRYRGTDSHAGLTYFDNHVKDLIAYSAGTMINVDEAEITGAELNYDTRWSGYALKINATAQNPRDAETHHLLARRSLNYGTAEVGKKLGRWYNAVQGFATSKRYDDAANATPLGGYAVLNLVGSYALNRELVLRWRAENLLDRRYEQVKGYNTPGRSGYLFLEYRAQ